jgi:glycosyltransferase involved in cell wall biosynthesis
MKIGIDTFACDGGKSGVGVYLSQILRWIPPSFDAKFELFGWEYDRFSFDVAGEDLEFIAQCSVEGTTANALWHQFKYPKFARMREYSACFFPAAHKRLPWRSPVPSVGVVHDMAAYWGTRKTRQHLGLIRMILPNALRNLDRIIAVSGWVKQELIELAHVKESRIEVVSNGVDHSRFYPRPRTDESVVLIQPFSFRRPYIIYASRLDHPIKNHVRLIKAFEIFKNRTKHPHRLVLAGAGSLGTEKIKETAVSSPYRSDIFFTGHFPAESLPELYAGANFAVFPSMYEGFGLGILEAMASGVPVACARAASLPEIAENAALYFDPMDPEDMADRMVTLSSDRDTAREIRTLGLERVRAFSWDECARQTLGIIHEVATK